ncbi:hypothetical protein [Desulfopila inferna]|uniref:hypothetical protein n=1 Tax=Desulfopila inferna TaxID=468528 RepID=UPI001963DB3B|nr:hypothetical protein [Desulfopila inferna]MBM9606023.1 hypothetical protein [Desulfopila inferna]
MNNSSEEFFLPIEECEKNVGNRKYVVVEVWIGIGGVEMWQRLKVEKQDPQNVFPWLIGG